MSVHAPNFDDLHAAGKYGMGHFDGDPDVARDLGIAVGPEDLEQQIVSSAGVARAIHEAHHQDDTYPYAVNLGNYAAVAPAQKIINKRGAAKLRSDV